MDINGRISMLLIREKIVDKYITNNCNFCFTFGTYV